MLFIKVDRPLICTIADTTQLFERKRPFLGRCKTIIQSTPCNARHNQLMTSWHYPYSIENYIIVTVEANYDTAKYNKIRYSYFHQVPSIVFVNIFFCSVVLTRRWLEVLQLLDTLLNNCYTDMTRKWLCNE